MTFDQAQEGRCISVFLKRSIHSIQLTFGDCKGDRGWDKREAVVYQSGSVLVKFQKGK